MAFALCALLPSSPLLLLLLSRSLSNQAWQVAALLALRP